MNMKSKSKWMILVLMLALVFTACGKTSDKKNETSTASEATATPEVTATPTAEPATATPEATVPETESKKIVSFSPSITEIIYALGAGDMLVGRTDYCDYPEEALQVESIGDFYTPNIEKVVSLDPDVVIASALWTDDIEAKFTEAGIEVLVLEENAKVEDVYSMITTLGTYLGKETEATALVDSMKTDLATITDAVSGLEAKSVYYVVGYGESGDYTATGDTYINDMLTLAGGDNIAKDVTGWSYSLETLIEKDPDIILIGSYAIDDFLVSENYQGLSAVKNKQVYAVDTNLLDRQSNRTIEGVRLIASILHPEAFSTN
jgi:iron complex transport system substrate-binding protein